MARFSFYHFMKRLNSLTLNKFFNMRKKNIKLMVHIAFWAIVIILPWFILTGNLESPGFFEGRYYLHLAGGGFLFYITYYWLGPAFYLNNQKIIFFLLAILMVIMSQVAIGSLSQIIFPEDMLHERLDIIRDKLAAEGIDFRGPPKWTQILNSSFTSFLVISVALGIRISEAYNTKEEQNRELERAKLSADLSLLKNQVNPHFFFNTLNNIYALTEANSPYAGMAVLKLSKMMRYVITESEQGNITLDQELAFMNNYIDLMRLRISEKVKISVDFRPHSSEIIIPPMLFISFIENAFKHGISYLQDSYINISLKSTEDDLTFVCINSKVRLPVAQKDECQGIGLNNVKKRLMLLYPENHSLQIEENDETYSVTLTLKPMPGTYGILNSAQIRQTAL